MGINIGGNLIDSTLVKTFNYKNIITRGLIMNLDAGTNE